MRTAHNIVQEVQGPGICEQLEREQRDQNKTVEANQCVRGLGYPESGAHENFGDKEKLSFTYHLQCFFFLLFPVKNCIIRCFSFFLIIKKVSNLIGLKNI